MTATSDSAPHESVETVRLSRSGLSRVGARPGLVEYLRSLWQFRSFIIRDSRSRVLGGSSEDSLGRVWLFLNPILNGATYFFVFGILFGTGRGIPNFIGYLIIGVFLFRFTSSAITAGAKSITGNRPIVRAFTFPRATLPISVNVRELLSQGPMFAMMILLILAIPPFEGITWLWLLIIPLVALQFLFNVGLSLVLARMVDWLPDIAHLLNFATRVWLYLSAVFFSVDRFADHPTLMRLMELNPMFCVLDIARDSLLYAELADPKRWLVLGGWTALFLVVGIVYFWQAEERYGRER